MHIMEVVSTIFSRLKHVVRRTTSKKGKSPTRSYLKAVNAVIREVDHLYIIGPQNEINLGPHSFDRTSDIYDKQQQQQQKVVYSFCKRRPDVVLYKRGAFDEYSITFFGNCKPFYNVQNLFTDEEIAHVLDMGIELLRYVQPWREFLVVFLTDTRRWQFFRIDREEESFSMFESNIYMDGAGWTIYLSLLMVSLGELGFCDMAIDGVYDLHLLGNGKKFVFSGRFAGKELKLAGAGSLKEEEEEEEVNEQQQHSESDPSYIFKVFPIGFEATFERERQNLKLLLSNTADEERSCEFRKHLPHLVLDSMVTRESLCGVLTLSPVDLKVLPCEYGNTVLGQHILQLLDTVEYVHRTFRLVHRDIKPDNIYLSADKQLLILSDWGSAAEIGVAIPFEGTYGFSDRPYSGIHYPYIGDDLKAMVKSTYLMFFNVRAPRKDDDLVEFWESKFFSTFWEEAIKACHGLNRYSILRSQFTRLVVPWK